jgi:hypothetical protein
MTCRSSRSNFISGSFSYIAIFSLEYEKNNRFLAIIRRKI